MDVRTYIGDNVLRFFGASDSSTVDFIQTLASSAKTPSELYHSLAANGLPSTPDAQAFVTELHSLIPRKSKSSSSSSKKAAANGTSGQGTLVNQKYALMLDDDDDAAAGKKKKRKDKGKEKVKEEKPSRSERDRVEEKDERRDRDGTKKIQRSTRKREVNGDEWVSDEEEKERERKRRREMSEEERDRAYRRPLDGEEMLEDAERNPRDDETEEQRIERERLEDIAERDAFAERIKQKDAGNTKKLVVDRSSKAAAEAAARRSLADDNEARQAAMPDIRGRSRQEYLKKREQQRLDLLKLQIQDEEILFRGQKMSRREEAEHERNKELLRIMEERQKIDEGTDGYMLPDDYITEQGKIDKKKKSNVLYQRYEENKPIDGQFVTDIDQWEAHQTGASTFKTGAMDKIVLEDQYDYVMDESQFINWIQEGRDEAEMTEKDRAMKAQIEELEQKYSKIEATRKALPVYEYRDDLLEAIAEHQILIVEAETGSGKTTQLPQYLHEAGYTKDGMKVGCTQPRRVAAMSVAARVAEEMGVRLGQEVGYSIRFEDATSDKTVLKYMTDGMLLREFLTDPELSTYSALVIDEAHERTLSTDILFGLIKDIARFRPELRLLISSATLNAQKFAKYFDDAPIFRIPGRRYAVDLHYTAQPEANYIHAAVTTVFQIHTTQPKGDILVFLTGQDEIEAMEENLKETAHALGDKVAELIIAPIYANLPSDMQAKIFEPTPEGARKVVLATNIAETSITIDGVVYVIDPGFVKQNNYNPKTGMESLVVEPISRASAQQRSGRAGRVGPGKAFRLYTKWAFQNELLEDTIPEIQRTNLGNVVLMLKSLGINDLLNFDFLDPPPAETLIKALESLYALGALNHKGELTRLGRRMAEFPVDPMLSKAIIQSEQFHCTEEVLTIISMLQEGHALFYRPKDKKMHADKAHKNFWKPGGDHFAMLNIWEQWVDTNFSQQWCMENFLQFKSLGRVRDIRDQLAGLCERVEVVIESNPSPGDNIPIQKALTSGYFFNTARIHKDGGYRTTKSNQTVYIHPSSSLFQHQPPPRFILYYELVLTSKEYMRQCMPIEGSWLLELAPHAFNKEQIDVGSSNKKMPKARQLAPVGPDQ
ncbi:hypothetical protein QFC22_004747 [Naganishia vaughanmartiniae]|uniref:Uncharacterized protein n=1 Tax=Naganishia vaughanmartiniae TaxID=1424756 RepID=A0ACC2WZ40_9TREE|nr:hypothetical protein QFC22_004747 [Naganishia vaughanmartiniae]